MTGKFPLDVIEHLVSGGLFDVEGLVAVVGWFMSFVARNSGICFSLEDTP